MSYTSKNNLVVMLNRGKMHALKDCQSSNFIKTLTSTTVSMKFRSAYYSATILVQSKTVVKLIVQDGRVTI